MVQTLEQVDVTVGSIDVAAVAMPASGDEMIPRVSFVGTVARFQVEDPCVAVRRSLDIKRLVDNTCQSAIGTHWRGIDSADVAISKARDESMEDLGQFGICLLSLRRSHLGTGVALFNLADWTNTSKE
jgi:hypothetical protein